MAWERQSVWSRVLQNPLAYSIRPNDVQLCCEIFPSIDIQHTNWYSVQLAVLVAHAPTQRQYWQMIKGQ